MTGRRGVFGEPISVPFAAVRKHEAVFQDRGVGNLKMRKVIECVGEHWNLGRYSEREMFPHGGKKEVVYRHCAPPVFTHIMYYLDADTLDIVMVAGVETVDLDEEGERTGKIIGSGSSGSCIGHIDSVGAVEEAHWLLWSGYLHEP